MKETKTPNQEIAKAINAFSQNNFSEAESICLNILSKTDDPDANHIIGCLKMREKKFTESILFIEKAIKQNPDNHGYHVSLGCALSSDKKYTQAIKSFLTATQINSDVSQVHFYLGEAYRQIDEFKKSLDSFKKCLTLSPDHIGCQLMIGVIYEELKKFEQAIKYYKSCIDTYPEYAEPHINLGMCYLLTGNYIEGWTEYEWRLKLNDKIYKKDFLKPKWNGEDINQKTLLVICEQGFSDTIQFIRFSKLLSKEGARIIIMGPKELKSLLTQQAWITDVIDYDQPIPSYDYYIFMLSFPKLLEWTPTMDTQDFPYLEITNDECKYIDKTKINVGLLTQTNVEAGDYKQRSVPLNMFKDIFKKEKHNIISLDYYLKKEHDDHQIIDCFPEIQNLEDTCKIIKNLDLIISIDSLAAHLAGALNKEVWVLLSAIPGWRWDLNHKTTTPWYQSAKLFRQELNNNWTSVMKNIKNKINSYV